jgi:hypothetical protein
MSTVPHHPLADAEVLGDLVSAMAGPAEKEHRGPERDGRSLGMTKQPLNDLTLASSEHNPGSHHAGSSPAERATMVVIDLGKDFLQVA